MRHHISTATKIYLLEDILILLMILIILQIFTYTYHIILPDIVIQTIGILIALILLFATQFLFDIEDEYYDLLRHSRTRIIEDEVEQHLTQN